MRKIFFLPFFLFVSIVNAQVPNGGFESWVAPGRPQYWELIYNSLTPPSVLPDSDAHSGVFSAHGFVVLNNNGLPSEPYLGYEGPSAVGFSVSQRYAFAEFWCKLHLQPGDVLYTKLSMYDSHNDPVGEAVFSVDTSVSSWTFFSFPVVYDSSFTPAWCSFYFSIMDSTFSSAGHIGSEYYLDDITLSGLVPFSGTSLQSIAVYPNPSNGSIHLKKDTRSENQTFSLIDLTGKELERKKELSADIDLENIAPGIYFLVTHTESGNITKKIIVQ